jgi:hypothetical protein
MNAWFPAFGPVLPWCRAQSNWHTATSADVTQSDLGAESDAHCECSADAK